MEIDQHFGFIAFAWLAGLVGFVGLFLWIGSDRKALDRQLTELEARGLDVSRAKDPA